MAERSLAGRVRRAVADAAAVTRLAGTGNAAPATGGEPAAPEPQPAPDADVAASAGPGEPARSRQPKPARTRTSPAAGTAARKATAKKATAKDATAKQAPAKPAGAGTAAAAAGPAKRAPAKRPARPSATPPPASEQASEQAVGAAPAVGDFLVADHEEPWTAAEIDEIRQELAADLQRLQAEVADADAGIADLLRDPAGVGGEDQADAGSKTFEREHEMALAASHRELLAQTERALLRLDDGSFGRCESCGNAIGKARVQAFPRATLCLACKQREERR
jgi:RNA polymerase-binding transcription factor DksA